MAMRFWVVLFVCLHMCFPVSVAAQASKPDRAVTSQKMQSLYRVFQSVLGKSFDLKEFSSPKNHKKITEDLSALERDMDSLTTHFSTHQNDYQFIARALRDDLSDVQKLYNGKKYLQARFVLHQLTTNCISCHTKIPAASSAVKADDFFNKIDLDGVSGLSKAKLLVMMRKFELALASYEKSFSEHPEALDSIDFYDYLKLAIRVKFDFDRIEKLLERLRKQVHPSSFHANYLQMLQSELLELKAKRTKLASVLASHGTKPKEFEAAITEIDKLASSVHAQDSHDPRPLSSIVVSSLSNQLLEKNGLSNSQKSHLFYLLGVAESQITDSFWFSELEYFLEQSIRIAPKEKWAKQALVLLEEEYLIGYSGSSGIFIPNDVKSKISELRKLVGSKHTPEDYFK